LLYAAVVRASELYELALDEYEGIAWTSRRNGDDGNEFAAFWVPWLQQRGVEVKERRVSGVKLIEPDWRWFRASTSCHPDMFEDGALS
jgi:hypothetical protein